MKNFNHTHHDTLDCIHSFVKEPNKLMHYLSEFDECLRTVYVNDAAFIIENLFEQEIGEDTILFPEIHIYDVKTAISDDYNDSIKKMIDKLPSLTLCLIKLKCGELLTFVDAFFCSRNTALLMLKNLENHLDEHKRSYHVEYHGLPHSEMLESLHCNDKFDLEKV
ncbi:hypothetical protein GRJ22_00215 [Photobacterium carnosum]|uniref:hypothetical protein n=1 Tax=Photobacterium carnosum TaxID=2023717 RepID=UPI001E443C88|nr:hypothetical protein [Photobacterium carnosum]MCD9554902.1 hypothetical protein [Photobacterium carnosum]